MANSNLIDVRMKLSGGRAVVSGLTGARKETEKFGSATSKASKISGVAGKATSRLTGAYRSLSTTAKAGLGFLGVGGVLALESAVHASEELAKTTTGLTRNLDFQTNVASRWGAVAQAREIDSKALTMSFTTLSRRMVEAGRKGGTLLTPFHMLGLSQEDASKGADNFQWGLMRVAKAFGEAKGGAVRQAAAQQLLGKGYSTILPLFSEGTKSLKEQLHWADKYGVTLSGKTNEGLMDMVTAQRESKVAMLGLQVSLTKALMPAIEAGQDQLHEFIATLNDPKLTDEQKFRRIGKQFEGIEDDLIKLIDKAGPEIAEHAGRLGLSLAGAVWHGFINSDSIGKLAIGGWLFAKMGGLNVIGGLGARVGGKLATTLGWKFLETVAPYFAAEAGVEGLGSALGSQMGGLKTLFGSKGKLLGTAMGVAAAGALVAEIVFAVENSQDIAGLSLFDTPSTGATSLEERAKYLKENGYKEVQFDHGKIVGRDEHGKPFTEVNRGGKWVEVGGHGGKQRSPSTRKRTTASPPNQRNDLANFGSGGGHRHLHLYIDGKEVAVRVAEHADDAAAVA